MSSNMGVTMTLANSIIGVSVLAMPFCFKQCGIILSIVMLMLSSLLSRFACYFLLKAAIMARRRNFEFLAFHAFGPTGKFLAELCIIGFLMGTCIAFFVVVGDLGPEILAKMVGYEDVSTLRPSVLICLAVFVVLPLGLLRNVDSLSAVSMATIGFYICLVLKVVSEAMPHLLAGDWMDKVHLWRPAGIMQCIPIFSMALSCQTQLFEIYESLFNASLERMNEVIKAAVNMCTGVYICVGFFGYVAFCTQNFTGNILMSFSPTKTSEIFKLGFVLSVAVSFPLVIFPCRASLNSLLFRRAVVYHETASSHIPDARFKWITVFLVGASLGVGLLIPNIELVLGLIGSTIGVLICVIFPAVAFIRVSPKASNERIIAQIVLFSGILILVTGSYATLNGNSSDTGTPADTAILSANKQLAEVPRDIANNPLDKNIDVVDVLAKAKAAVEHPEDKIVVNKPAAPNVGVEEKAPAVVVAPDVRQEPPVPVEPPAVPAPVPTAVADVKKEIAPMPLAGPGVADAVEEPPQAAKLDSVVHEGVAVKNVQQHHDEEKGDHKREQVAEEAIRKEEHELAEAEKQAESEKEQKNAQLLETLARHKQEQEQLLKEQKHILHQIKQQQQQKQQQEQQQEQKQHRKQQIPIDKDDIKVNVDALLPPENQSGRSRVDRNDPKTLGGDTKPILEKQQHVVDPPKASIGKLPELHINKTLEAKPLMKRPLLDTKDIAPSDISKIHPVIMEPSVSTKEKFGSVDKEKAVQKKTEPAAVKNIAGNSGKIKVERTAPDKTHQNIDTHAPSLSDIVFSKKQLQNIKRPLPDKKSTDDLVSGTVLLERLKGAVVSKGEADATKVFVAEKGKVVSPAYLREKREVENEIVESKRENCHIAEKTNRYTEQPDILKKDQSRLTHEFVTQAIEQPKLIEDSYLPAANVNISARSSAKNNNFSDDENNSPQSSVKEADSEYSKISNPLSSVIESEIFQFNSSALSGSVQSLEGKVIEQVTEIAVKESQTENMMNVVNDHLPNSLGSTLLPKEAKDEVVDNLIIKSAGHLSPPDMVSLPPAEPDVGNIIAGGGAKPMTRDLKSASENENKDDT